MNHILRMGATGQLATDIRSEVATVTDMQTALQNGDVAAYNAANIRSSAAANIIRADLGLPPPPHY